MIHTVGIMGANGLVGGATAKKLAQSAKDGKIMLVIAHRSGNPPKNLDAGHNIEFRELNLDDPAPKLEAAVKGINVFISAVGFGALPFEPNLVDALAKSTDLVTYIPSTFTTPWTAKEMADPQLGPVISFLHAGVDRATAKGVGVTLVYTGIFDIYFFEYAFVGCPLKQNTVWANKGQMQNSIPITAIDHLAQSLHQLATLDPKSIKDTEHSVVTFWPTGQDVADLYTKINGKPAEIKDFTAKDRDETIADAANFGPAKAGYWNKWERGQWEYEQGGRVYDNKYTEASIEQVARKFA